MVMSSVKGARVNDDGEGRGGGGEGLVLTVELGINLLKELQFD